MPPRSALALLRQRDHEAVRTIRLGVLVPWANTQVETELPRLHLRHCVFHHARVVPASRTTALDATFLHDLHAAASQAADSLSRIQLDSTVLACTSAGFTTTTRQLPGIITAYDALRATLQNMRCLRVALATPYPTSITDAEVAALQRDGFTVTGQASLDLADGYPDISADVIGELVARLGTQALAQADALVLSCTGWPTLDSLRHLEHQHGLPVLSSNLAIAMYAAHLATTPGA